tara:strand:- start:237 stop:839 length:603 start_codon:yes stop_codon:yes gene_type:complete
MNLRKRYKNVYGKGVNDSDYTVYQLINGKRVVCKYYKTWKSMLERCYSDKYQDIHPTYKGCTACKEWLTFSNFKKWMEKQDWEGKQLDKDILIIGNKIYSPATCIFITHDINLLLTNNKEKRGLYPQGVSLRKDIGMFQSHMKVNGRSKNLGLSKTPEEAHSVYCKAKAEHIYDIALKQTDFKLMKALITHGDLHRKELI